MRAIALFIFVNLAGFETTAVSFWEALGFIPRVPKKSTTNLREMSVNCRAAGGFGRLRGQTYYGELALASFGRGTTGIA